MKKLLIVLLSVLLLTMSACSGSTKTVSTKEEAKAMAEDFFKDLLDADQIKMESYSGDKCYSAFTKDGDKMYVDNVEAGYGYYTFIKDGVKYLIADDLSLFEDEAMYDMTAQTIEFMLTMNVMGYFETEDDSLSYKATNKEDKELLLNITGNYDGTDLSINVAGTKEDGKVVDILSSIKYGEQSQNAEYKFSYDEHVELPEYKVPVTYNNMPHVDSPYETFGDIISKHPDYDLFYTFFENELVVIDEHAGRHYQFSSTVSDEVLNTYSELDFFDDDYDKKVYDLLRDIEIEDCIDFTDYLPQEDELKAYADKTVQAMIDDGYEVSGYVFYEDSNYLFVTKDLMTYRADVIPAEGFDPEGEFEYEDLYGFTVTGVAFDSVEYAALPMN